MCTFFTQSTHTAAKTYGDDAFWGLERNESEWLELMTEEEKALYQQARERKGKILPGMRYVKCPQIADGDFVVFRGSEDLLKICHRLDIWADHDC